MGRRTNWFQNHTKYADGQDRRYDADPAENQTPSYSAEIELEGNEVNPWPCLCSIMQRKLYLSRETKLAAYNISTSTLRKHVEVNTCIVALVVKMKL